MKMSNSTRGILLVVAVTFITAFILLTVIAALSPVKGQTVTVQDNEVVIRIKVQVEGLTSPSDTVYVTRYDTTFVDRVEYVNITDTLYVDRVDTVEVTTVDTLVVYVDQPVYVDRVDTLYITQFDTTYIDRIEYVDRVDTTYIDRIEYVTVTDTTYITSYDTLYYPVHASTEVAFNDVPSDHRRVERIIIRPVGWAAGRIKIKGSDDPWWTDIEMEVSTGDIWGTGDYMMYINIPTTDWTYAAAMLDSLEVQDHRARTGLHIRQSYEPGSPFVFLAYQNGRASVNMRNEWGGEVVGHPDGGFEVALPIVLQVNMTDQGFDARIYDVWTDSVLHSWSLPNYFEGKFYTGIATTSWSPALITRAWYSMLNILDAVPWNETCRDGDGNLTDCPEDM